MQKLIYIIIIPCLIYGRTKKHDGVENALHSPKRVEASKKQTPSNPLAADTRYNFSEFKECIGDTPMTSTNAPYELKRVYFAKHKEGDVVFEPSNDTENAWCGLVVVNKKLNKVEGLVTSSCADSDKESETLFKGSSIKSSGNRKYSPEAFYRYIDGVFIRAVCSKQQEKSQTEKLFIDEKYRKPLSQLCQPFVVFGNYKNEMISPIHEEDKLENIPPSYNPNENKIEQSTSPSKVKNSFGSEAGGVGIIDPTSSDPINKSNAAEQSGMGDMEP